jgi:acyl-CoA thioester hydrolase
VSRLLEPPEGRQVFQLSFEPQASDIDENGHVNNVVYLRWIQEIATAHWRAKAPPDQQDSWAWIVLRHEVDYRRPLKLGEVATART